MAGSEAMTLYTVPEAAGRLGISANSAYAEIATGRLPCLKMGPKGGKIRLTDEDLAAYLEACRAAPAAHRRPLKHFSLSPAPAPRRRA